MCFCQFCGCANCKDCLKKTRPFFSDDMKVGSLKKKNMLNSSSRDFDKDRPRGKICKLCSAKFHIHTLFTSSFEIIDAQVKTLAMTQKQNEGFIKEM